MTADGVKPRPEQPAAPAGRPAEVVAGGLARVGFIDMRAQAEVRNARRTDTPGAMVPAPAARPS